MGAARHDGRRCGRDGGRHIPPRGTRGRTAAGSGGPQLCTAGRGIRGGLCGDAGGLPQAHLRRDSLPCHRYTRCAGGAGRISGRACPLLRVRCGYRAGTDARGAGAYRTGAGAAFRPAAGEPRVRRGVRAGGNGQRRAGAKKGALNSRNGCGAPFLFFRGPISVQAQARCSPGRSAADAAAPCLRQHRSSDCPAG